MTRKFQFEELHNFRDFGGYNTLSGRALPTGRFYRSANHGAATDADLERLSAMNIGAVVDLRRPSERNRQPSRRWKNFNALLIENHESDERDDNWDSFLKHSDLSPDSIRTYMKHFYVEAPFMPRHVDLFTRYFETLAKTEGALLVHCVAGKDRTGMIVALTHTLAGVHQDDIMAEYLLTNDPERIAKQAPQWQANMIALHGRAPEMEAMHVAMGVEPPFLEGAFAAIKEKHGDIESYVRDALGVDAEKRKAIEKRLFE